VETFFQLKTRQSIIIRLPSPKSYTFDNACIQAFLCSVNFYLASTESKGYHNSAGNQTDKCSEGIISHTSIYYVHIPLVIFDNVQ
jgi:hypothetical protein